MPGRLMNMAPQLLLIQLPLLTLYPVPYAQAEVCPSVEQTRFRSSSHLWMGLLVNERKRAVCHAPTTIGFSDKPQVCRIGLVP